MVEIKSNIHISQADLAPLPSLGEATRAWAKIAALSFGGPAGQIAVMHKILVEEKRWIDDPRFLHALNFCMLLPGPEAMQLATYSGWMMHGVRGGIIAGSLFVLPGLLAIMALSVLYVLVGDSSWMSGLFFGLKAAVVAIIFGAVLRVASKALKSRLSYALAIGAFFALFLFALPFPIVILVAGVIGWLASRRAKAPTIESVATPIRHRETLLPAAAFALLWGGTIAALYLFTASNPVWVDIGGFFSKLAVVTFGGAYAVLAYVGQVAVSGKGWLAPGEMLDGLGMAESTPGPLIMVLQFVGFLAAYRNPGGLDPMLAGVLGGLLTTWVTFLPCFLWVFLGAPYIERLRGNAALSGALSAVTAAVVGVIANLAFWFTLHFLFGEVREATFMGMKPHLPVFGSINWAATALSALAVYLLLWRKWDIFKLLGSCVALGLFCKLVGVA